MSHIQTKAAVRRFRDLYQVFLYHVSWDYRFYRAMVCVGAVFAVARCRSVCHVGVLYPDC